MQYQFSQSLPAEVSGAYVLDVIQVACPVCAQQPGEECVWARDVGGHPRFHAGRFEVAGFIYAAGQRSNAERSGLVDEAFASVVDAMT